MYSIIKRIRFHLFYARIGPDMPLTHWMLHFKSLMRLLAKKKLGAFGENAEIRPGAYLVETKTIFLGKGVIVRPNCMLFSEETSSINVGNNSMLGSGVHIYCSNHSYDDVGVDISEQGYESAEVIISDNVWIGANTIIQKGVTIGTHTVVAAGSVVVSSLDPYSVYAGNPARKLRSLKKT